MKIIFTILFIYFFFSFQPINAQNVSIGGTGTAPHPSALLNLDASPSFNTGFAMPRLTTSQRLAIPSPIDGLQVYDTNLKGYYFYNTQTNKWDCATTPAGTIGYFANVLPPIGYLICDGSEVSRNQYPELFNAIGTLYGSGDGVNTFDLPDARGEFIRGVSLNSTVDTGRLIGSKQDFAIENIKGQIGNVQFIYAPTSNQSGAFSTSIQSGVFGIYPTSFSVGEAASNLKFDASSVVKTATETRPKNIAFLICIKY